MRSNIIDMILMDRMNRRNDYGRNDYARRDYGRRDYGKPYDEYEDDFDERDLRMAANMLYSDFCEATRPYKGIIYVLIIYIFSIFGNIYYIIYLEGCKRVSTQTRPQRRYYYEWTRRKSK